MSVRIILGDCRERLRELPDESVHTCVTSPPYFGLRDYGVDGQIGLEDTPDAFVAQMVEVFREVRRVLRDDGTLWLNLGDSYAGSRSGPDTGSTLEGTRRNQNEAKVAKLKTASRRRDNEPVPRSDLRVTGLKAKDMIGAPWRVAFALQADGWYLRQDIIWHKPNPMPESIKDRCTKAHEYVFLLSKSPRYHFDADAISEACSPNTHARVSQDVAAQIGSARANGGTRAERPMKAVVKVSKKGDRADGVKSNKDFYEATALLTDRRNKRSVWTVSTEAFSEAHFATYPPALIEPCILAGCPKGGVVLDPFGGAGTTGLVADYLGRDAILIELNAEYAAIAERRLRAGLAQVDGEATSDLGGLPLFAGEAA